MCQESLHNQVEEILVAQTTWSIGKGEIWKSRLREVRFWSMLKGNILSGIMNDVFWQ